MRKLTIKEFASATGQKDATVRQHINRKKILKTKDGFIDVDTVLSKTYITEVTNGAGLYGAVVKTVIVKEDKEKPVKPVKSDEEQHIDNLNLRKRVSETELKERESELKGILLEKQAGNLLPVDVVERIFVINVQAIFKNVESSLENMARITTDMLGGSRSDAADIVKRLREELSVIIEKAKKDADHEIKAEIYEMMDKKK